MFASPEPGGSPEGARRRPGTPSRRPSSCPGCRSPRPAVAPRPTRRPRPAHPGRLRRAAGGGTRRRWCCSRSRCCRSRRPPRTSTPSTAGAWRGAEPGGVGGAGLRGRRVRRRAVVAPPRVPMLATATGVLVLCTTGMPSVVEPVARFTTAWLIAASSTRSPSPGTPPPASTPASTGPRSSPSGRSSATRGGAAQLDVVLRWFPPAVVARVDDRRLRAGPLDARRHPGAVGRGVAVRRPELDRAGLLLAAGHRHRPAADRADLRARPAGDPAHRRRGGAGLAVPAPGGAARLRCCAAGSSRR